METKRAVRSGLVCRFTVGVILVLCMGLTGWADGPVYNLPPEESEGMMSAMGATSSVPLPFDPDAYSFLIYVPHGSEDRIEEAMVKLGISPTVRDRNNGVTLADLQSHDILIVGWNAGGNVSGLDSEDLATGITGRILISGHDLDYHTAPPSPSGYREAAERTLIQAIHWVLEGGGTGLITLGCIDGFPYLPEEWGISAAVDGSNDVVEFTDEGLSSGIFDSLEPDDMDNWSTSFHNYFTAWGDDFVSFEKGRVSGNDKAITIARSHTHGLRLIKTDNRNPNIIPCVLPEDEITYTIDYSRRLDSTTDLGNVVLADILPMGVTFLYEVIKEPVGTAGVYDPITRTITWQLGEVAPGDSGSVSFVVQVNDKAEPSGYLRNRAELRDEMGVLAAARINTPVCCWSDGIIYVDRDATGANIGTSWENAYTDLQSALARAAKGCGGEEIWVAAGLYSPGTRPTDTFTIPDGVSLYGGFAGREPSLEQRNLNAYPSVLSGYISDTTRNETIVTMGHDSLLDGFTVRDAGEEGRAGILGQNVNFVIKNCIIEENKLYGVLANNSNVLVKRCTIKKNGFDGIYHDGNNSKTITIENCRILNNGQNGVYTRLSTPQVYNSQINLNGTDGSPSYGLYLFYPKTGTTIQNNTLVYNANQGIRVTDPNTPVAIRNCILWGNKLSSDQDQMTGNVVAFYSCVYDPNTPNQTTPDLIWKNISCYPEFAYDGDPNATVYRLLPGSPCIDKGDPALSYDGQVDIDGLPRVMGLNVDMGASEFNPDCGDVYNPWDLNADGLVNLYEFAKLSRVWLAHDPNDPAIADPNHSDHEYRTDPNSPGYITLGQREKWYPDGHRFNIAAFGESEYSIDLADLMIFAEDVPWLWTACWRQDILQQQMMTMMFSLPKTGGLKSFAMRSGYATEETKTAEMVSQDAEQKTILGLLEQIDVFIDAGGDDADTWTELKYLLEYTLSEAEDTINQSEMF